MKNKNIAILINSMYNGGAERVVSILNEQMISDDVNIHLLVIERNKVDFTIQKNIKFVELSKNNSFFGSLITTFFSGPMMLKNYCIQNNIHFVISHLYRANYVNVLSKLLGNKSKSISVQHSHASNTYRTNSIKDIASRFLIKNLISKSDIIYTVSELMKIDLTEKFNISSNKIFNVKNPIDLNDISYKIKEPLNDLSVFGKFTFITMGSFVKRKNHELIIKAAKLIADLDFKIIIMGRGSLKNHYYKLIQDLNLKNKISVIDFNNNPFNVLSKCDCLINSSDEEGLPMAILEGLACELAIISSDCLSGPREILSPKSVLKTQITDKLEYSKYGILFPVSNIELLAKAMRDIITNNELKKSYKSISYKRAEFYSVENVYELYKKHLLNLN
ncbi:glycosyltransferase [Flavobacteriaceae bacterium]|nr:glycosyltransferase [Flavobacteriaceae bacterium]